MFRSFLIPITHLLPAVQLVTVNKTSLINISLCLCGSIRNRRLDRHRKTFYEQFRSVPGDRGSSVIRWRSVRYSFRWLARIPSRWSSPLHLSLSPLPAPWRMGSSRPCSGSPLPPLVPSSSPLPPLVPSSSPLPPLVPSSSPMSQLVPSSSPLPPLAPSSSPMPPLVPSSSPSPPLAPSSLVLPERPTEPAPPEWPLEGNLPKKKIWGGHIPLVYVAGPRTKATELPDLPWSPGKK